MIIDSHAHIGQFKEWNCSIEDLYSQMQREGIKQAIISNIAGNEFDYEHKLLNEASEEVINQQTLESIQKYQGIFKMLVWIRPFSEKDLSKLEAFIKKNREVVVGLKVHPYCAKVKLNDQRYNPYIHLCEQYKLPFCIHTEEDGYSNVAYIKALAEQYPNVNFVAVHMGLKTNHKSAIDAIEKHKNLYGDTTLVDARDVLQAIKQCGQHKILFGSDAITIGDKSYDRYLELFKQVEEVFGEETVQAICCKNIRRIFNLENDRK